MRAILATAIAFSCLSGAAIGEDGLQAGPGWRAELAHDNEGNGVWTVGAFPVFDAVGSREIVALDDRGRCLILIPYSGRWTALECVHDGSWLGGLAHGDLDPRIPGRELYTGGKNGHLYQVVPHPDGVLETRRLHSFKGEEIHTLVLGDLDPGHPGNEMLVFTWPGGLYRVQPGPDGMPCSAVQPLGTRVRDAVVLPAAPGKAPEIAVVTRGGSVALLQVVGAEVRWTEIHRLQTGFGRIAMRSSDVLYAVCDDGCVYRYARGGEGSWTPELIYAGPQGMRGIVAGAFDADAGKETLAVFGYSHKVELLTREADGWRAETAFEDTDKGHWLATAEVDGRNATPEIFACGYGGRVVMLARPPGYGRPGVLAEGAPRTLRVGVGAMRRAVSTLTPLSYPGEFLSKTLVYETLVRRDDEGRLVPGLAQAWERSEDGRRWIFTLREGARFHDGAPCDAAAVKAHFDRWVGRPEHDWLGCNRRIASIRALDATHLEFTLTRPWPLPADLVAINPTAIAAEPPVGSGPFRVISQDPRSGALLDGPAGRVELRYLEGGDHVARSHIEALASGEVDLVADGWVPQIPRDEARALGEREAYRLLSSPGSTTVLLDFNRERGPFAEAAARRRLEAVIDRGALIEAEDGFADPTETLFAVAAWPRERVVPRAEQQGGDPLHAVMVVYQFDPEKVRAANLLARQARRAGIGIDVVVASRSEYLERTESGDYDLVWSRTHGLPYDPHTWLVSRFLPGDGREPVYTHPDLTAALEAMLQATTDEARAEACRAIEEHVEREAVVVPVHVPHRLALLRRGVEGFRLGRCGYVLDLLEVRFEE